MRVNINNLPRTCFVATIVTAVLMTTLWLVSINHERVVKVAYFWDGSSYQNNQEPTESVGQVNLERTIADTDNNQVNEIYSLNNGTLSVYEGTHRIWKSPADWQIDNFVIADSNNDGVAEINLSLWKPGNFGTSKPFWVKDNDMSVKNHFFIYNIEKGKMKLKWGSSNLPDPNTEFTVGDVNNDGENELIVIEGSYSNIFKYQGDYVAVWKWGDWGFVNEWRSEKGRYSKLELFFDDDNRGFMADNAYL